MNYEFIYQPYPLLKITLAEGETLKTELGTIAFWKGEIEIKLLKEIKSYKNVIAKFSGKSLIYNLVSAKMQAEIFLAPKNGQLIQAMSVENTTINLLPSAFLANSGLESKVIFKDYEPYVQFSGSGVLFFEGSGNIHEIELQGDEKLTLNEKYLLAFEDQIKYTTSMSWKEIKRSLFQGDDYSIIEGAGKIWLQTRLLQKAKNSGSVVGGVIDFFT